MITLGWKALDSAAERVQEIVSNPSKIILDIRWKYTEHGTHSGSEIRHSRRAERALDYYGHTGVLGERIYPFWS